MGENALILTHKCDATVLAGLGYVHGQLLVVAAVVGAHLEDGLRIVFLQGYL